MCGEAPQGLAYDPSMPPPLGGTRWVAEEVIGEKNVLDYTQRTGWVERLLSGTEAQLGAALIKELGWEGTPQWR